MRGFGMFMAAGLALAAAARAAPPDLQRLTVRNDAERIVECAVVVDGKARTFLKIRPHKLWAADYDPRRKVQLVCERAKDGVYAVKAGSTYALTYEANRVQIAEATGE